MASVPPPGGVPPPPPLNAAALGGAARVLAAGGLLAWAAANSLFNVEGGHRAIVFNRVVGIKDAVYSEGTHLMVPWFERPVVYDVRARPSLIQSTR
jgi:prohibitin 2